MRMTIGHMMPKTRLLRKFYSTANSKSLKQLTNRLKSDIRGILLFSFNLLIFIKKIHLQ